MATGYVNFTEKYKYIQGENFLSAFRVKQILSELDKLSFRDDRRKIKALLAELSSGLDEAAMLKVVNRNLRFPEGAVYYAVSDFHRLKKISLLHYAVDHRSFPDNLVSIDTTAAQLDDDRYHAALTLYYNMLFELKSTSFSAGSLFFAFDRKNFETRFGLIWKD